MHRTPQVACLRCREAGLAEWLMRTGRPATRAGAWQVVQPQPPWWADHMGYHARGTSWPSLEDVLSPARDGSAVTQAYRYGYAARGTCLSLRRLEASWHRSAGARACCTRHAFICAVRQRHMMRARWRRRSFNKRGA